MKSCDLVKRLEEDGWFLERIKGDHLQFRHPTKPGTVPVPAEASWPGTYRRIRSTASCARRDSSETNHGIPGRHREGRRWELQRLRPRPAGVCDLWRLG